MLLGRRVALQPDIGASASEMVFGTNVRIPGQILYDPGEIETPESLNLLLQDVREKTNRVIHQPSRHNPPEKAFPQIPDNATHAYTRQHQTSGLQAPFEGPFRIVERLSNSTIKLEVGKFKDGTARYEIRHLNDIKFAHPESLAAEVQRPSRGRPSNRSSPDGSRPVTDAGMLTNPVPDQQVPFPHPPTQPAESPKLLVNKPAVANQEAVNHETSNSERPELSRPVRSTRNPSPKYIDAIWIASDEYLQNLNKSINTKNPLV